MKAIITICYEEDMEKMTVSVELETEPPGFDLSKALACGILEAAKIEIMREGEKP